MLPDGATLPASQPPEIAASIAIVTLTPALRKAIAAASPQLRLIRANVAAKIAEQYSLQDEIKLIRTRPSAEFDEYSAFAEECRSWGADQRTAMGL